MTIYTQQPADGVGQDSYLNATNPDIVRGTGTTMGVGYGTNSQRSILRFTLAGIPSGIAVSSAYVSLVVQDYSHAHIVDFFRVLKTWDESDVCWSHQYATTHWATDGCANIGVDREDTSLAQSNISGDGAVDFTLNAAGIALLQNWINNPIAYPNYGWLIKSTTDGTGHPAFNLRTSEYATESSRPKITINYLAGKQFYVATFN